VFLPAAGPPAIGDWLVQSDLGQLYRIRDHGRRLYRGEIARMTARYHEHAED